MTSEWNKVLLAEITSKIGSGATPRGGKESYYAEGLSLIRSQNVLDFKFSENGLAFINQKQAYELRNVEVLEGDILLNITGDSVARACLVPTEILPARVNQHVAIIRVNTQVADPNFILYSLLNPSFKKYMLMVASDGGTRNALTKGDIEKFEIKLPDLKIQEDIAKTLSALDDKISLLRRQNETLEQIAQEIFRHWFVDFEFPDEHGKPYKSSGGRFVSSELGDIPEDWESVNFFDEFELLSGGTPKTSVSEYWDGEIRWISAKDVTPHHRRFILDSEKKITEPGVANSAAKMLPPYTVVISARGTVGNFCIIPEEMCISQSNYGIKAKKPNRNCLTYLYISHLIHQLKKQAYGSVFDTITSYTFRDLDIVVPGEGLAEEFENLVLPFFKKMLANEKGIQSLMSIRDTLMPKLMNGEIRTN